LAIVTSRAITAAASALGIPMLTSDIPREIDLTIDGATEVDPTRDLIKGGGALLREKIVAQVSHREVIVVGPGKLSPRLGTHSKLPVEVLDFGWCSQARFLESLGAAVTPRTGNGGLYCINQGNIILHSQFGPIADTAGFAGLLEARAGIVGHGLFIGIASDVIVAGKAGIRHLRSGKEAATAA